MHYTKDMCGIIFKIFNIVFNIGGWFTVCILTAFILGVAGLIIRHICFFLYGLFTWQKRVPVYKWCGNSFLMDQLSFSSPDHYEWRKMKMPTEWLREMKQKIVLLLS